MTKRKTGLLEKIMASASGDFKPGRAASSLKEQTDRLIAELSPREREVLNQRFGISLKTDEQGEESAKPDDTEQSVIQADCDISDPVAPPPGQRGVWFEAQGSYRGNHQVRALINPSGAIEIHGYGYYDDVVVVPAEVLIALGLYSEPVVWDALSLHPNVVLADELAKQLEKVTVERDEAER